MQKIVQSGYVTMLDGKWIRKDDLDCLQNEFLSSFFCHSEKIFNLKLEDLSSLDDQELIILADIIYDIAGKKVYWYYPIIFVLLCLPIIGWYFIAEMFCDSSTPLNYLKKYRKLKRYFGNREYFPLEKFRAMRVGQF